jgi:F0F1-type ATP synthase membrane subunit b/b'
LTDEKNTTSEEDNTISRVIPIDSLSPSHNDDERGETGEAVSSDEQARQPRTETEAGNEDGTANGDSDSPKVVKPLFASPAELPDLREHHDNEETGEDAGTENEDHAGAISKSREEFTTVYDLIDQMSTALEEAKSSLFAPGMVRLDRDEFVEQLSQLKAMLPIQLERASSLMREAERRLQNAQSQSQAIISKAQSHAAQIKQDAEQQAQILAGQERVVDLAQQKARVILDDAQSKSTKLVQGANVYCVDVMKALKEQISAYDRDIRNGIEVIDKRQRAAASQLAQTQDEVQNQPRTDSEHTNA